MSRFKHVSRYQGGKRRLPPDVALNKHRQALDKLKEQAMEHTPTSYERLVRLLGEQSLICRRLAYSDVERGIQIHAEAVARQLKEIISDMEPEDAKERA